MLVIVNQQVCLNLSYTIYLDSSRSSEAGG